MINVAKAARQPQLMISLKNVLLPIKYSPYPVTFTTETAPRQVLNQCPYHTFHVDLMNPTEAPISTRTKIVHTITACTATSCRPSHGQ